MDVKKMNLNHVYDNKTCRHTVAGFQSVLHCHHYMTLTTMIAEDSDQLLGGTAILISTMENTAFKVLGKYYKDNNITDMAEKIRIAAEYFSACGLGQMVVRHVGDFSATIELLHSHVDEGWIKKFGKRDKPLNYVGRGYCQAMLALLYNKNAGSYASQETQSIVKGAPTSIIKVWLN